MIDLAWDTLVSSVASCMLVQPTCPLVARHLAMLTIAFLPVLWHQWTLTELQFVPSATYDGDGIDGLELFYYKNRSSTYKSGEANLATVYSLVRFWGELAADEFRIAGLSVPNQSFINAERGNTLGFINFYFGYEGVIGLAPRWNTSLESSLTPSPWSLIVNQSIIDRNLFALELPRGPQNLFEPRTGTISFGGIDEKYKNAHFAVLPLSNYSDQAWIFEAQSITWTNKTHPIHQVFVNQTLAGFDSTAWFLALPGKLNEQIRDSVPHQCGFIWCFVDCDDRKHMPDLIFELGGHNFTLTAEDYAPELFVPGGGRMCSFELYPSDGWYPVDAIVLGKQFMSKYYR